MELRQYQSKLVIQVVAHLSNNQDALIEQPTGSGKTLEIIAITASLFKNKFTHIIIAAPQQQIEEGFLFDKDITIKYHQINGVCSSDLKITENLFHPLREDNGGISNNIKKYLDDKTNNFIATCTHAALNRIIKEDESDPCDIDLTLPLDLSTCLLVIDEAHHASADALGSFINSWKERDGVLLFATATPYRKDGREVIREDMELFRRPLAEHMEEGFAPKTLYNEIIGVSAEDVNAEEFTGEEISNLEHRKIIIEALCEAYERDDKPKLIIRIPPGKSEDFMKDLQDTFELRFLGIRILNGVGTDKKIQENFIKELKKEKDYNDSKYDIVVGVQRVLEGTDWSICSHVYCVGIPGSLTTVTQLTGRALRLKKDDHPYKNSAHTTFFVLGAKENALKKLEIKHSRHALLSCIFMADYNVGKEWAVTKAISDGIKSGLANKSITQEQYDKFENDIRKSASPEDKLDVEIIILRAQEEAKEKNVEYTPSYVFNYVKNNNICIDNDLLNKSLSEHLSKIPGSTGDNVCSKVRRIAKQNITLSPKVDKTLRKIYEEIVNEFRDETLDESKSLIGLVNQVHAITGGNIKDFCQRLIGNNIVYTIDQVKEWTNIFFKENNKLPNNHNGNIDETNITWSNLDSYFRSQSKGLVGYESLSDFLEREFGKIKEIRDVKTTYNLEQVKEWTLKFLKENGKRPSCNSGNIDETNITWSKLDNYFRSKSKGLVGYESLSDFIERELGEKTIYNIDQAKEWVREFLKENNKLPNCHSGNIDESNITWSNLDSYFRNQSKGLIGYNSLSDFIEKEFDKRKRIRKNRDKKTVYTVEQIRELIFDFFKENKKYPSNNSGNIDGTNITWANVNWFFKSGYFIGYKSLSDFINKQFGREEKIKQYIDKTIVFSTDQVKKMVSEYIKKNGKRPSCHSGSIDGINITWSKLDNYFRNQSKGLVGYKSLSDFIEKECKSQ
jgi:superfamily II DNA or RNA helicase